MKITDDFISGKKERKIDKINRFERTFYPLKLRNEVEEKYFQDIQKRNKEKYGVKGFEKL